MRSWGERQSAGHRAELNRGPRLGGKQSGADALRRAGQGRAGGSRASRAHGFATTGLGERPRLINQKIIESPHALPLLPRCRFLSFSFFGSSPGDRSQEKKKNQRERYKTLHSSSSPAPGSNQEQGTGDIWGVGQAGDTRGVGRTDGENTEAIKPIAPADALRRQAAAVRY